MLGKAGNPFLRDRASCVFLNPVTLEPLQIQRASQIEAVAWLNELADPLHFGYFGGLPTKLIWFVFGLGMTGLSVIGVWLTWKRLKTSAVSRAQFATFPVLLVSLAFATGWYERLHSPSLPGDERLCATLEEGVARLEVFLEAPAAGAAPKGVRLLVTGSGGRPNIVGIEMTGLSEQGDRLWQPPVRPGVFGQTMIARYRLDPDELVLAEALKIKVGIKDRASAYATCRIS